jgi:hypothetical protein
MQILLFSNDGRQFSIMGENDVLSDVCEIDTRSPGVARLCSVHQYQVYSERHAYDPTQTQSSLIKMSAAFSPIANAVFAVLAATFSGAILKSAIFTPATP